MSFENKHRGEPGQELLPDFEWNRAENDAQLRRWEGPPDYIDAIAIGLQNGSDAEAYSITNTDDGKQLLVAVVTNTDALPQWELIGNELTNAVEVHPRFSAIKDIDVKIIRSFADAPLSDPTEENIRVEELFDDLTKYPAVNYDPIRAELKDDGKLLRDLLTHGTTSYIENQYTLRRTFIVGSNYDTKIPYNNLNQLYTTSELGVELAAEGTPFPGTIAFSIGNIRLEDPQAKIPVGDTTTDIRNYVSKWLKKRPQVASQGGGRFGLRFQITQEYVLYNWNRRLYLPLTGEHPGDTGATWTPRVVV